MYFTVYCCKGKSETSIFYHKKKKSNLNVSYNNFLYLTKVVVVFSFLVLVTASKCGYLLLKFTSILSYLAWETIHINFLELIYMYIYTYLSTYIHIRNTIKISYSCTNNFRSKIIAHNNKILNKSNIDDKNTIKDKLCNCRKEPYPLNNQCLVSNIIYK